MNTNTATIQIFAADPANGLGWHDQTDGDFTAEEWAAEERTPAQIIADVAADLDGEPVRIIDGNGTILAES